MTNIFGMVVVITSMILMLITRPKTDFSNYLEHFTFKELKFKKVLEAVPTCVFLLAVHILAVEFRQEIKNPKKFLIANAVSCIFSALLNAAFATICAIFFYDDKSQEYKNAIVLNMIKDYKFATLRFIAAFFLSFNLCFSLMMLTGSLVGIVKSFIVKKKTKEGFQIVQRELLEKVIERCLC